MLTNLKSYQMEYPDHIYYIVYWKHARILAWFGISQSIHFGLSDQENPFPLLHPMKVIQISGSGKHCIYHLEGKCSEGYIYITYIIHHTFMTHHTQHIFLCFITSVGWQFQASSVGTTCTGHKLSLFLETT